MSREKICNDVKSLKHDLVIKPTVDSSSGKNIKFIQKEELAHIERELDGIGNDYIIQYAIEPHTVFSKIDNIHAGGLVVGVEDTGRLLPTAYQLGYGDNDKKYTIHPLSGIQFEQITLPCMTRVINAAYSAHAKLPRIGIVSWDFTVDKDENPVLIEANIKSQSIWFPQIVHGKGAFEENTPVLLKLIRERK